MKNLPYLSLLSGLTWLLAFGSLALLLSAIEPGTLHALILGIYAPALFRVAAAAIAAAGAGYTYAQVRRTHLPGPARSSAEQAVIRRAEELGRTLADATVISVFAAALFIGNRLLSAVSEPILATALNIYVKLQSHGWTPFIVIIVSCLGIGLAYVLHGLKVRNKLVYGYLEIAFGCANLFYVSSLWAPSVLSPVASELAYASGIQFVASIYIIVRGLSNVREARQEGAETPTEFGRSVGLRIGRWTAKWLNVRKFNH